MYHEYNGPATLVGTCAECGLRITRQVQAQGVAQKHDYAANGSGCTICGQADVCKHSNIRQEGHDWDVDDIDNYTIVDENCHSYDGPGEIAWWCTDCGRYFPEEVSSLGLTFDHEYEEGSDVCQYCGYDRSTDLVCTHENTIQYTYIDDEGEWTDNGDGTCTFVGLTWTFERCRDCGAIINDTSDSAEETTFTEPHALEVDMERGCEYSYCWHCGAIVSTDENHPGFEMESWTIEDSDLANPKYYEDRSDEEHYYVGPITVYGYCPHCEKDISLYLPTNYYNPISMKHVYREGGTACLYCGYKSGCQHENVDWQERPAPGTGWVVSSDRHSFAGPGVYRGDCPDCGQTIIRPMEHRLLISEPHHVEDTEADGASYCTVCEYLCYCGHQNVTITRTSNDDDAKATPLEDGRHHVVSGSYTEHYWCADCCMSLGSCEVTEESEFYEEHTLEDGVCTQCGYKPKTGCSHEETVIVDSEIGFDGGCLKVDGKQHRYIGDYSHKEICCVCGEVISEEIKNGELLLYHVYEEIDGENIGCARCSYVSKCEHANLELEAKVPDDIAVSDCISGWNAYSHEYCGPGVLVGVCPDCECTFYVPMDDEISLSFTHEFVDGRCVICGYRNTCSHPEDSRSVDISWEDFDNCAIAKVDNLHHSITGEYVETTSCSLCGDVLTRRTLNGTIEEVHEYDDDGECQWCHHVNTCTHENTVFNPVPDYDREDEFTYKLDSDYAHIITGPGWMEGQCSDCGEVISVEQTVTVTDLHSMNAIGVCEMCGYATTCSHPADKIESVCVPDEGDAVASNDGATHTFTGNYTIIDYCGACGCAVSSRAMNGSFEEGHSFLNGVCVICGYEITCDHENAYTWVEYRSLSSAKYENAASHVYRGSRYLVGFCLDCNTEINKLLVCGEEIHEAHTLSEDGSYCTVCESRIECAHALSNDIVQMDYDTAAFSAYDELQHRVKGNLVKTTVCPDCGMIGQQTVVQSGVTSLEFHYFNDSGVCIECGYRNSFVSGCDHEYADEEEYVMPLWYAQEDEDGHSIHGYRYTVTYCPDCGMISMSSLDRSEIVSEYVSHEFSGGVCTDCLYRVGCAHTFDDPYRKYYGEILCISDITDSGHVITVGEFETLECSSCGEFLSKKLISTYNKSEQHDFEDGVCYICGYTGKVPAKSISVRSSVTLGVGQSYTLSATVSPANHTSGAVKFKSSNTKVVTVDSSGKITAKKTGTATITVTCGSAKAVTCKVTVKKAPSKITLTPTSATLGVGMTGKLKYTLSSGSAASVKFTSSNANVATVDDSGLITAVGTGKATITATTHNKKTAKMTLTVCPAPTSVKLNSSEMTLGVGQSGTLKASANAGEVGSYTFRSLNPDIATVSSAGQITAKKVGSVAVLAITQNGASAQCTVTVKAAPTRVTASPSSMTLGVGQSSTISVQLSAGDEECAGSYTFTSSNAKVATVNGSGKVTAKKTGTTTITVKSYNGKTAKVAVTVKKAPTSIKLSGLTLGVGDEGKLKYTLSSGSAASVSFASSNTAVATVDGSGNVTALSVGKTTITVKTHNGKKATATVTVKAAPTSITLSTTSVTIGVGQSYTVKGSVNSGAAGSVKFESLDTSVLSASASGAIKGVAVGTAELRASTYNGVEATCTVTVKAAPTKVTASPSSMPLGVGQSNTISVQLSAGDEECAGSYSSP